MKWYNVVVDVIEELQECFKLARDELLNELAGLYRYNRAFNEGRKSTKIRTGVKQANRKCRVVQIKQPFERQVCFGSV